MKSIFHAVATSMDCMLPTYMHMPMAIYIYIVYWQQWTGVAITMQEWACMHIIATCMHASIIVFFDNQMRIKTLEFVIWQFKKWFTQIWILQTYDIAS